MDHVVLRIVVLPEKRVNSIAQDIRQIIHRKQIVRTCFWPRPTNRLPLFLIILK